MSGLKYDNEKPRLDLFPFAILLRLYEVEKDESYWHMLVAVQTYARFPDNETRKFLNLAAIAYAEEKLNVVDTVIHPICSFALAVHPVLEFGEKKYAAWNWAKGISDQRLISAFYRHMIFANPDDLDPESGLEHWRHALCCIMFICAMPREEETND